MSDLVYTNSKYTCMPLHVFKQMPLKNIMKAIEANRKKVK